MGSVEIFTAVLAVLIKFFTVLDAKKKAITYASIKDKKVKPFKFSIYLSHRWIRWVLHILMVIAVLMVLPKATIHLYKMDYAKAGVIIDVLGPFLAGFLGYDLLKIGNKLLQKFGKKHGIEYPDHFERYE